MRQKKEKELAETMQTAAEQPESTTESGQEQAGEEESPGLSLSM